MNYFDYAIIGVMALFLLIGFCKGFIKTGLSILTWGISFAIIYFAGSTIVNWFMSTGAGNGFANIFEGLFSGVGEFSNWTIGVGAGGEKIVVETGQLLTEALKGESIPGFVVSLMLSAIMPGSTIAAGLGRTTATYASYAIVAIGVLIVVAIIMSIISIVIHKSMRSKRLGFVNRLVGGILYIAVGLCFVSVAMIVIDLMEPLSFMNPVIEMRNAGKISSIFIDNNPLILIFKAITKS